MKRFINNTVSRIGDIPIQILNKDSLDDARK